MSDRNREKLVSNRRRSRLALSVASLVTEQEEDLCQLIHFKTWAIKRMDEMVDNEARMCARITQLERTVQSLLRVKSVALNVNEGTADAGFRGAASPVTPRLASELSAPFSMLGEATTGTVEAAMVSEAEDVIEPRNTNGGRPDRSGRCTFPSNPNCLQLTFQETETQSPGPLSDADTEPPTPPVLE